MRTHNIQPGDSVAHTYFNCFGQVKEVHGDDLVVEWENQDEITEFWRSVFPGDINKYPGDRVQYQHVIPAERCVVREHVEAICRCAAVAFKTASDEEGTAIFELFEVCDEALAHVQRSPKFPHGRLASGDAVAAGKRLEAMLTKHPRLRPYFERQRPS